jgi:hypothetical protein
MEDPQPNILLQNDRIRPSRRQPHISSIPESPEHSRARSKNIRTADQPTKTDSRPWIRRRESYADGTRRGRSRTRSVSPESTIRRAVRRRRSRSPSRSCSTTTEESPSPGIKRQRTNHTVGGADGNVDARLPETPLREGSRESMRSRSKRRKKYRRRSDYASAAADTLKDADLSALRKASKGGSNPGQIARSGGRSYDKTESFESVLEEEEDGGEP